MTEPGATHGPWWTGFAAWALALLAITGYVLTLAGAVIVITSCTFLGIEDVKRQDALGITALVALLLLPAATHGIAGPVLALSSTLAGNLLIVGSIANIIVVGAAQRRGIHIGWKEHARVGVPVTVATMAIAAGWLWLRLGAGG